MIFNTEKEKFMLFQKKSTENKAAEAEGSARKSKKKKLITVKRVIIAVILLLVILILRSCFFHGKAAGVTVYTDALMKGEIRDVLSVSGPLSGSDSQDIMSSLHARILEIHVKEGDHIEAGQLIAKLDTTDAERSVKTAQDQLELAKANLEEQKKQTAAEYQKASQALSDAKRDLDRKAALFASGDISSGEMEQARTAWQNADATLKAFTVKDGKAVPPDSYRLQVSIAENELSSRQKQLQDATIVAPISGTVTRINTKVGQFADNLKDNKALFTIENLDSLKLEIPVSEHSIGKVHMNQQARIHADIMGTEDTEGIVSAISPSGEEKGGSSNERVIPITIQVTGDAKGLIPGITARAQLLVNEKEDVFSVPIGALIQDNDGNSSLAIVRDGRVYLVKVNTGIENDTNVEVSPADASEAAFAEGAHFISTVDTPPMEGDMVNEIFAGDSGEASTEETAGKKADSGKTESGRAASAAETEVAGESTSAEKAG